MHSRIFGSQIPMDLFHSVEGFRSVVEFIHACPETNCMSNCQRTVTSQWSKCELHALVYKHGCFSDLATSSAGDDHTIEMLLLLRE